MALTLRLHVALAAAAVAVALAAGMAAAQAPVGAPAPAAGISPACMDAVLNMSDCLTYVTNGSTARRPDAPCCPELAGLLGSNPVCLCQLLAGGASSYGMSIDYKRALALPGICHLTAPPVSACAVFGVPVPMAPSAEPLTTGHAPSPEPQMPEKPPSAAPSSNHSPGRFTAGGLTALVAAAAAVMF
ncbi:hypothetical protein GUJ93_ZPchr0007g4326 [Zizania palustris]|uniref:Bifunctional inhibitor/plant lipid transfer protein/seed storage helical domain-containing protein n=1 Tax=Zizania palustris TaxID=103762 RepID=A0A8J5SKH2_ZIZPA|nr:hypothetical protein GUJ93_ZPchr0007g4326 [Zizania palustris]